VSSVPETDRPLGEIRSVVRDDWAVEYVTSGAGPTVVLLPALAGSVREFNPLVARLNGAGYRTLGVHFTGVGQSRRPFRPRPTLFDFADDVRQVLAHAGVPDSARVCVVGRALGNRVARAFASRHPARTAAVVLLAAGGKYRARPRIGMMLRYLWLQCPWLSRSQRRRILESLLCVHRNVLPDYACERPRLRAVLRQSGAARRTDWRQWWGAGQAPLLVIQGTDDRIADPQFARDLQQEFPDRVQLELVPECGHSLLFDQPERVMDRILTFLSEQVRT
jgi:pimeloyl-ACP methyl ester carboxylesterase